jgi:hypothetical protein
MKKFILISGLLLCFVLTASAYSVEESREIVAQELKLASSTLAGKQVDFMTTCVDVLFDGTNAIYVYMIDESYCKLANVDVQLVKQTMMQIFNNNEAVKIFFNHLKNIDGKAVYVYIGSESRQTKSFFLPE